MSVTTLDTLSWLQSPTNLFVVSLLGLFALSLGSLKLLFGTFSFWEIYDQYKTRKALSEKYLNLFTARDNLMYHISWAKARGDNDEAIALSKDLVKLDKARVW